MSLFNNKLSKVPLGMLDQDVQDKFTGYDTSLAENTSHISDIATITPEQYGAKGDGINNDQSSLQNAINYLNSIGGGKLKLKTGATYLLGTAQLVLLQLYSNITIQGNATFKVANNLGNYDRIFDLTTVKNVVLKDFTINSNNTNNKRTSATTTNNNRVEISAWNGTCDNVLIDHITVLDTVGTWQITLHGSNCHVKNSQITFATDSTGYITYDRTCVYMAVIGGSVINNVLTGSANALTALELHGDFLEVAENNITNWVNTMYIVNDSTIVSSVNLLNVHHNYFSAASGGNPPQIYFALNANVQSLIFKNNTVVATNGFQLFPSEIGNFTCTLADISDNNFQISNLALKLYSFKTTGSATFQTFIFKNNKITSTVGTPLNYFMYLAGSSSKSFNIQYFICEANKFYGSVVDVFHLDTYIDGFTNMSILNNEFFSSSITQIVNINTTFTTTGNILCKDNHYHGTNLTNFVKNTSSNKMVTLHENNVNSVFQTSVLTSSTVKTNFTNSVLNGSYLRNSIGDILEVVNGSIRVKANVSAIPTTGVWAIGDDCKNTAPTASGFMGWVCVTSGDFAGTPPVFKGYGTISA